MKKIIKYKSIVSSVSALTLRLTLIFALVLICGLCSGCQKLSGKQLSEKEASETRDIFAMDTYMTLTIYGEKCKEAADAAEAEIKRLDALLSTGSEESEVTKINKEGGGKLSKDMDVLVKKSLDMYEKTDGIFDITIYPVMKLWGFSTKTFALPDQKQLDEKLSLVDASKISYDAKNLTLSFKQKGMEIDFGGIAKGYTSDRVIEVLKSYGIEHAMINLGGNVDLLGKKVDESEWKIAVQDPKKEKDYIGILSVSDQVVVTSGGYERYFEEDGVRYHHIIDPNTGYPANNGLASVTIVSKDGTMADALSTSLFIMGKDNAMKYWRENSDLFSVILIEENGIIYISEDIKNSFDTNEKVEIIKKS